MKLILAISMSFILSNIPFYAAAGSMITTQVVIDQMSQAQTQEKIESFLLKEEVRRELLSQGVTQEEIRSRLASLSPTELQDLTIQMDHAQAGGSILVTVLLVVLIIYLVKRI